MPNIFSPNFCSIFVENKYFSQIQQSKQPDRCDWSWILFDFCVVETRTIESEETWLFTRSPRLTQLWCPRPRGWELRPVKQRGARAFHMRMRTPSAGHVSSLDHVSLPSRVLGQPAWQGSLRPSTPEALHVPEMEILVLIIKFHPKRTFGQLGLCLALFYNA